MFRDWKDESFRHVWRTNECRLILFSRNLKGNENPRRPNGGASLFQVSLAVGDIFLNFRRTSLEFNLAFGLVNAGWKRSKNPKRRSVASSRPHFAIRGTFESTRDSEILSILLKWKFLSLSLSPSLLLFVPAATIGFLRKARLAGSRINERIQKEFFSKWRLLRGSLSFSVPFEWHSWPIEDATREIHESFHEARDRSVSL